MFFIDLNKKKIVKDFTFHTVEINVNLPSVELGLNDLRETIHPQLAAAIFPSPNAVLYNINLYVDKQVYMDTPADGDAVDQFFLTAVNIISADLFKQLVLAEKRPGEYRLDVPAKIKQYARTSLTALKELVNHKTVNDIFSFSINYDTHNNEFGVYHFDLIDQTNQHEPDSNIIERKEEDTIND